MNIEKREKLFYMKTRLFTVWGSYMLLIGIFILITDLVRNNTQTFQFYFTIIVLGGLVMALFEILFFRSVIKAQPSDLPEIEQIIKALSYNKSNEIMQGRTCYVMSGRKYFLRSADIILSEADDLLYLNINIFHLHYFKKYKVKN